MALSTSTRQLPAFLQSSRADIHHKFVDLEWQQRHRLAEGLRPSEPASQWARLTGDEVAKRNRYVNIDPFQSNRVRLRVPEGVDDYINASPIVLKGSKSGSVKRYIATQGPKESSVSHLWRMVWHETGSVAVIVMLTQTHETGREKCYQYYPLDADDPIVTFEDLESQDGFSGTVELLESTYDSTTRTTIRKLRLKVGDEEKPVWHYLFVGWPDFLIPEDEDRAALLELARATDAQASSGGDNGSENPRIVHCSAGVGRSGTFIALDYLLSELADGALDDVPPGTDVISNTVDILRQQRMMMVQGSQQYQFLYDVLKEQWLARQGPNSERL